MTDECDFEAIFAVNKKQTLYKPASAHTVIRSHYHRIHRVFALTRIDENLFPNFQTLHIMRVLIPTTESAIRPLYFSRNSPIFTAKTYSQSRIIPTDIHLASKCWVTYRQAEGEVLKYLWATCMFWSRNVRHLEPID